MKDEYRTLCLCLAALSLSTTAWAKPAPKNAVVTPPPIVLAPPSETYGDWVVTVGPQNTIQAYTRNADGAEMGVLCSRDSNCDAYVVGTITCDKGDKYPALVNAPSGAYSIVFNCFGSSPSHVLEFSFDKSMQEAMSIGGRIGLAMPMAAGQFEVVRFSLTGALRACSRAAQLTKASDGSNADLPSRQSL